MPAKLDRCVRKVSRGTGLSKNSAYAICLKALGLRRKKGGGWKKVPRQKKAKRLLELALLLLDD